MQPSALSTRRLITTAAIACAAALVPVVAGSAAASVVPLARSTPRAIAPRCATSGLVLWLNTQGSGTAGSIYYELQLTNLSGHTCTLNGFPGVSAINLGGHQLGSSASRDGVRAPRTVTLAGGATATAVLRIVDAGNFPAATCRQTTAAGLRVYPPNQTVSKVVPFPFLACARPGPVYLSVQVVTKA